MDNLYKRWMYVSYGDCYIAILGLQAFVTGPFVQNEPKGFAYNDQLNNFVVEVRTVGIDSIL